MDPVFYLPLALLALLMLLNLGYQYRFWLPFVRYRDKLSVHNRTEQPVSVVIAARNEAENLQKNLAAFLEQDYPQYEVVVVNHCSFDETGDVLKAFQQRYPQLKVVTLEEQEKYPTGKKFALTIGIKAASYPVLLLSDADCYPASNQWVRQMQKQYLDKTEIVLGYCGVEKEKSLLNLFIQYDNVRAALDYFGHALTRRAFMGKGGNLSYLRSLFFYHKGFVSHIKHPSGDDALFVNRASTKTNTRISVEAEAFTYTRAKSSWSAWHLQKKRHQSTGKYFKLADLFWLYFSGIVHMAWLPALTWALLFYAPFTDFYYASIALAAFTLLQRWLWLGLTAKRFGDARFVWLLPFIDFIHPILQFQWTLRGLFYKGW